MALAMGLVGLATAAATKLSFEALPNPTILILGAVVVDIGGVFAKRSRLAESVRAAAYAILYLALASVAGVLAAYAGQRLAAPLQDDFFAMADRAIGFDWLAATHWVDRHVVIAAALRLSYATMSAQIAAPAIILAFAGEDRQLRIYLLAFAIGLAATAAVAAILPALSPIALIDPSRYGNLRFTGASPLSHLSALRTAGPAFIEGDLGGILSFPSFHATVAILTPLVLARHRLATAILLPIDLMMSCAAVTEGAHYASDVVAGIAVAVAAYASAARIVAKRFSLVPDRRVRSRSDIALRDRTHADQPGGVPFARSTVPAR